MSTATIQAEAYVYALDRGLTDEEADRFAELVADSGIGRNAAQHVNLRTAADKVKADMARTPWGRLQLRIYHRVVARITGIHNAGLR